MAPVTGGASPQAGAAGAAGAAGNAAADENPVAMQRGDAPVPASATTAQPAAGVAGAPPSADSIAAAQGATGSGQSAPATGVTFPVRPATTAATQAPAPAVGHASAADAGSIGGALFSLVLVIGLILALGWLAKRMPGMQRGAAAGHLKIVASIALGPRDRAVVVDVAGTQLLLGVGPGGVRTLHTLEAPLPVAEAASAPSPFAQILAQHFGRKP
jgi:flagellar protein FliO/FliZ